MSKKSVSGIKAPAGLDERARKEFRRIKPLLESVGYSEIDEAALTCYLTHYSLWLDARDEVARDGATIMTPSGQRQIHPAHSIMKQNAELVKKYIQELGLSAGSRKKMGVDLQPSNEDDELFN